MSGIALTSSVAGDEHRRRRRRDARAAAPVRGGRRPGAASSWASARARLLEAGSTVFARKGFHAARVDDVVTAAAAATAPSTCTSRRRRTCSTSSSSRWRPSSRRWSTSCRWSANSEQGRQALRDWLARFADLYERYGPVIRTWTEAELSGVAVGEQGEGVLGRLTAAMTRNIRIPKRSGLDPAIAALALMTMVERVNYYAATNQVDTWPATSCSTPSSTSSRPRSTAEAGLSRYPCRGVKGRDQPRMPTSRRRFSALASVFGGSTGQPGDGVRGVTTTAKGTHTTPPEMVAAVLVVFVLIAAACGNSTQEGRTKRHLGADGQHRGSQVAVNAPGVTATEIRVGGVASTTNPLGGNYGDAFDGVQAYFDMVNARAASTAASSCWPPSATTSWPTTRARCRACSPRTTCSRCCPVATLLFTGADLLVQQNVPTFGWNINQEWSGTPADPRANLFGQTGSYLVLHLRHAGAPWLAPADGAHKIGLLAYSVAAVGRLRRRGREQLRQVRRDGRRLGGLRGQVAGLRHRRPRRSRCRR